MSRISTSARAPRLSRLALAAAALALAGPAPANAPYYRVAEVLGDVPGFHYASAMNNSGQVAGMDNTIFGLRAFVWSPGGRYNVYNQAAAYGLNELGLAVGESFDPETRGAFFAAPGIAPVGASVGPSAVINVNSAGNMVGFAENTLSQQPVMWADIGTTPVQIGLAMSYRGTPVVPYIPLNSAGTVTGAGPGGQLSTWSLASGRVDLGFFPGAQSSQGNAINDAGTIAGTARFGSSTQAFIYNSGFTSLQPTGIYDSSQAVDINLQGDVVGYSNSGLASPGTLGDSPTLWPKGGAGIDLNDLRMPNRPNMPFTGVVEINDRGQILALAGSFYYRAFVLSPCLDCGQITPYPTAMASTTTIAGTWYDAYNEVNYQNFGNLVLQADVRNRNAGHIANGGLIDIGVGGAISNTSTINNDAVAYILVSSGRLTNQGTITNDGEIRLSGATGELDNRGTLLNTGSPSQILQVGGTFSNSGTLEFIESSFMQTAGQFEATGPAILFKGSSVSVRGTFAADRVDFKSEGAKASSLLVQGSFENRQLLALYSGTQATIDGGELKITGSGRLFADTKVSISVVNKGLLTIGAGAAAQLEEGFSLSIHSGGNAFVFGRWLALPKSVTTLADDSGFSVSGEHRLYGQLALADSAAYFCMAACTAVWEKDSQVTLAAKSQATFTVLSDFELNGSLMMTDESVLTVSGAAFITPSGKIEQQDAASIKVSGGSLQLASGAQITGTGHYSQTGGRSVINGELRVQNASFLTGVLSGSGRIFAASIELGSGVLSSTALYIRPGNSPGTLTVDGDVTIDGAILDLEVADYRSFDRLAATGNLHIKSALIKPVFLAGYLPELDDALPFLDAANFSVDGGIEAGDTLQDGKLIVDSSGLPAAWTMQWAAGAGGLASKLDNTSAVQIATVAEGQTLRLESGDFGFQRGGTLEILGRLDIAGRFTHRAGLPGEDGLPGLSILETPGAVDVQPEGRATNRAEWRHAGTLNNAGVFENREGATFHNRGSFTNSGRMVNDGLFINTGNVLNDVGGVWTERGNLRHEGGLWDNRGTMQVEGHIVFSSLIDNTGTFVVADGGSVTGQGLGEYIQRGSEARTVVDGSLTASRITLQGQLAGHGQLEGAVQADVVTPGGDALAALSFRGTTSIEMLLLDADATGSDRIVVDGDLAAVSIYLQFVLGYRPGDGASFALLSLTGAFTPLESLDFRVYERYAAGDEVLLLPWSPGDSLQGELALQDGVLQFKVSAVPEPHAAWLLLAGLGLLWRRRCTSAAATPPSTTP